MKRVTHPAEESNAIPTANKQNKNTASTGSVPDGSVSNRSGGEEEQQLHEADKCNAKIHYLSRTVASKHGINASAILSGFAYKLKFHRKNRWNNRWWYYDPIETLRTHRWPYLSDGCICENIATLVAAKLLIKDCNNKLSFDRTSWYAMDDSSRDAALSDLVWYDIPVTKKLGIPAGLIYHNLLFHLREIIKQDPECVVPHHKLKKALLSRHLPLSVATVKRVIEQLENAGLIVPHASKRGFFTIANEDEYSENGSDVNANGSSANGSKVNANGSSANANGSKVNANGSNVNDNTQYETNAKPVGNQSQKGGYMSDDENSSTDKEADDDKFHYADHKDVSDTVGSVPPGGKEGTETAFSNDDILFINWKAFRSFDQLIQQNQESKASWQSLDKGIETFVQGVGSDLASYFAKEVLSVGMIQELWDTKDRDQLVQALRQPFAEYILKEILTCKLQPLASEQITKLIFAPHFETLVRAFAVDEIWDRKQEHTMPELRPEIRLACMALTEQLEGVTSFAPVVKCRLFKQAIVRRNRCGWVLDDESRRKNLVQPATAGLKRIEALFAQHPELSVEHLLAVLYACLDIIYLEDKPDGFDKHWAARQGDNLTKLAQLLEKVVLELDMFADCPISASV